MQAPLNKPVNTTKPETTSTKENTMTQSNAKLNNTTTQSTKTAKVKNMNKKLNNKKAKNLVNKISINTNNMVVTKRSTSSLANAINATKQRAAQWYKTSIKELYDILGECYEIYASVEGAENKAARDYLRNEVEEQFALINANEDATTTQTRIISIVFNLPDIDRRTRSRYARVIKKAFQADAKPSDASSFVEWLTGIGGINKALEQSISSINNKPSQIDMEKKVEEHSQVKATIPLETAGNRFVVMLANPVDKEHVDVLWHSDNEALTKKIVSMVYKELNKEGKATEVKNSITVANELKAETAEAMEA